MKIDKVFKTLIELSTKDLIFIIITSVIVALSLILFLLSFVIVKIRSSKQDRYLTEKLLNSLTFIVDYNHKIVEIFNSRSANKFEKITLDNFLNRIEPKMKGEFNNWIYSFLSIDYTNNESNLTFFCDYGVKANSKIRYTKALFVVTSFDKENRLLYFDSTPLIYLPTSDSQTKSSKIVRKIVYNQGEIKSALIRGLFTKSNVYLIKFRKTHFEVTDKSEVSLKYLVLNNVFKIFQYGTYFSINEADPYSIVVYQSKTLTNSQLLTYANRIVNQVNEVLEINGLLDSFKFNIACGHTYEISPQFDESNKTLNSLIKLIEDNDDKQVIVFHNEGKDIVTIEDNYRSEIERIIKNPSHYLTPEYQAFVHIANSTIRSYAYSNALILRQSLFEDFSEFEREAKKYGYGQQVFSIKARRIISTFINHNEKSSAKLIYNISLKDLPNIGKFIAHINNVSEANLMFAFDNNELIDIEDNMKLKRDIVNLKTRNYSLALNAKINNYNLKDDTYSLFDAFIIDLNNVPLTQSSNDFIKIRNFISRVLKFKKPIILKSCKTWTTIELLVKSGVSYFSSDLIQPYSTLLPGIDKKIIRKLLTMKTI